MPIYEYRCRKGHTFEVMQSMGDDPVTTCQECREPVDRVFRPVAVHFKGSGFYTTDYGRGRSASSDSAGGGGEAKTDSKESKESKETKPAKSESSGESKSDSSSSNSSSSDS